MYGFLFPNRKIHTRPIPGGAGEKNPYTSDSWRRREKIHTRQIPGGAVKKINIRRVAGGAAKTIHTCWILAGRPKMSKTYPLGSSGSCSLRFYLYMAENPYPSDSHQSAHAKKNPILVKPLGAPAKKNHTRQIPGGAGEKNPYPSNPWASGGKKPYLKPANSSAPPADKCVLLFREIPRRYDFSQGSLSPAPYPPPI